ILPAMGPRRSTGTLRRTTVALGVRTRLELALLSRRAAPVAFGWCSAAASVAVLARRAQKSRCRLPACANSSSSAPLLCDRTAALHPGGGLAVREREGRLEYDPILEPAAFST